MKKITAFLLVFALALSLGAVAGAENDGIYVLMNIPYADFYASEVSPEYTVDAVTSATLNKPRTGALAGGSFHTDPEGSDITGIIFPVFVEDPSVLALLGGTEITDDSSVTITVTNRGQEATTVYEGNNALFEAPAYSWYVLSEEPAQYKTLTVDGTPGFSKVNTEAVKTEGSAALRYDRHADQVIFVDGIADALGESQVSGIILTADDGTKVGLRHIANIWRGSEIGFNFDSSIYEALAGKTIVCIEYLTKDSHYAVDTSVCISEDPVLAALSDSYIELFPEFAKEEYKEYWLECLKAYPLDDDTAEMYYTMLTQTYMSRLYGQEAIDAFSDAPEAMQFDCYFENGLAKLNVNGNIISGTDAEGNTVFSHRYSYAGDKTVFFLGEELPVSMHLYKTEDDDAGIFTWFAFTDDNLGETQHIEYRYGASDEFLTDYTQGDGAYWMPSGIQDGYSEKLIDACIKLFVDENVGEQFAEEPAA